jgi:hypothetical protein
MQTIQGNRLQSLRTVQRFLDDHAEKLPSVTQNGARRRFDAALADASEYAAEQGRSEIATKQATLTHRACRRALARDHIQPIVRIARAEFGRTPELEPFQVPRGNPSAEKLNQAAYAIASAAEPYADVFVAAGMPHDFVQRLTGAADEMLASFDEERRCRGRRVEATKGLKTGLTQARRLVEVLDSFVRIELRSEPALLANWESMKRVGKVASRRSLSAAQDVEFEILPAASMRLISNGADAILAGQVEELPRELALPAASLPDVLLDARHREVSPPEHLQVRRD